MTARVFMVTWVFLLATLSPLSAQFCVGGSVGFDPGSSTIDAAGSYLGCLSRHPAELMATHSHLVPSLATSGCAWQSGPVVVGS